MVVGSACPLVDLGGLVVVSPVAAVLQQAHLREDKGHLQHLGALQECRPETPPQPKVAASMGPAGLVGKSEMPSVAVACAKCMLQMEGMGSSGVPVAQLLPRKLAEAEAAAAST